MQRKARNTLIYLVLGFMPLASSLLLTPVYTQYLTPGEYGLIALATVLQTWLSLAVSLSLDASFSRFYFNHPDDKAATSGLLSTAILTLFGMSVIVAGILYFTGNYITSFFFNEPAFTFSRFGWPVLLTAVFGMCYTIAALYYRDAEDIRSFSILAIIYFLLLTGCTYYGVVIANAGAEGSIYGKMTGTVVTMSLFLIYILFRTGFRFQAALCRQMLAYSLPLFVYGMMAAAFDTMDRFFLSRYFDLTAIGQYNFAFVIASVTGIVIASFQSAVNPSIYRMFLDKTREHHAALNNLLKKFVWVALVFSMLCIVLAWLLILFFINPQYHDSLKYIPLLAFAFIPRAYYIVHSYPLFTQNRTAVLPVINAFSVIAGILSNLLLIPLAGVSGVVLSVVVIKAFQAAGAVFFIHKYDLYKKEIFHMGEVHLATLLVLVFSVLCTITAYDSYIYPFLLAAMTIATFALAWWHNKDAVLTLKTEILKLPR